MTKKKFTKMAAAIIAALCMTACGAAKTDAPGVQTSAVQTTPSAAQTSVPATQTTAPGVQTATPNIQTAAPTATEDEADMLHEETFTVSKTSYSILLEFESGRKTVYDFRDARNYGAASITNSEVQTIDFEGLAGIRLDTGGETPAYSVYRHSLSISETATIVLYRVGTDENTVVEKLGDVKIDTDEELTVKFSDGLYKLTATFTANGKDIPVSGYLYVEDGKATTCRLSGFGQSALDSDISKWNELLGEADPDDFLSNDKITFPTSGTNGACNHVSYWENLSDELVLDDDWSDEAKVFAFVDYLAKNIAYDNYRFNQPNHRSRANIAGNYKSDKYFTKGNNVGVCWDYTNILVIMCRHHGIACTSMDSANHAFNAVWLNGGWVGIDLTKLNRYVCNTEDTDKDGWKTETYSYRNYGGYTASGCTSIDQNIWTKERGLGLQ